MSKTTAAPAKESIDPLDLNHLTLPLHISHVKTGNTLCANEHLFIMQDGSTTLEISSPPKFKPTKIPWRNGLLRDIAWCEELRWFMLLTQKSLFAISADGQPTVVAYQKVVPFDEKQSFWRCACVGKTLYVSYAGFGTPIDEYLIDVSSCVFVQRRLPPKTCAAHEGIWCIRYHPTVDQIGFTVMDCRTNAWRFEIRERQTLNLLWHTDLPLDTGDCELSPLKNGDWLTINSCGIRLIQISNREVKAAVEYERELKNAITLSNDYFIIRTKNTIDIHRMKREDESTEKK